MSKASRERNLRGVERRRAGRDALREQREQLAELIKEEIDENPGHMVAVCHDCREVFHDAFGVDFIVSADGPALPVDEDYSTSTVKVGCPKCGRPCKVVNEHRLISDVGYETTARSFDSPQEILERLLELLKSGDAIAPEEVAAEIEKVPQLAALGAWVRTNGGWPGVIAVVLQILQILVGSVHHDDGITYEQMQRLIANVQAQAQVDEPAPSPPAAIGPHVVMSLKAPSPEGHEKPQGAGDVEEPPASGLGRREVDDAEDHAE